jgi:hypothetical protein
LNSFRPLYLLQLRLSLLDLVLSPD